jgi:cell wall-associated NlpC family hydrolase
VLSRPIVLRDIAILALPLVACSQQTSLGTSPIPATSRNAAVVIPTAERYLGVPYRWGGTSPVTGFDCSGYVQYVFARHGVELPRTSRAQAYAGDRVPLDERYLRAGDLIMFASRGEPISHVAIYAGRDRIIHSTSSGGGVRYDDLGSSRGAWFVNHAVVARRVAPPTTGSRMVRDLVSELRSSGVRVDFPLDLGDFAPRP